MSVGPWKKSKCFDYFWGFMEIGVNAGRLGEGSERDSWQRLMKTDKYDMVRSHMTIIPFPQKCIRPELIDRVVLIWLFMNLIIHRHRPQHWDDLTRSFHLQSRPWAKWPILDWHIHEWHMDRQDESRQGQQGGVLLSGQGDYGEGLPPLSDQQVPSGESFGGGDNLLGQTWL